MKHSHQSLEVLRGYLTAIQQNHYIRACFTKGLRVGLFINYEIVITMSPPPRNIHTHIAVSQSETQADNATLSVNAID